MGFMVVPKPLVDLVSSALSELYREGNLQLQAVLADFIEAGHFATHIRRMRQRYAQRQPLLRDAIQSRFGPDWVMSTHEAGLHLVMRLPPGADDVGRSAENPSGLPSLMRHSCADCCMIRNCKKSLPSTPSSTYHHLLIS